MPSEDPIAEQGKSDQPLAIDKITGEAPVGIRGWLLFFACSMAIRPIFALLGILGVAFLLPAAPADRVVLIGYIGLSLPMVAYCSYAAFRLWRKDGAAVHVTTRYLVAYLAYSAVLAVVSFAVPVTHPQVSVLMGDLRFQGLGGVFYSLLWTKYLKESVRVANTYQR